MIPRVPFHQHREILGEVLRRLAGTPLATLMTVLVLGAALALPGTLLTLTDNLQRLAEGYAAPGTLNVFLEPGEQAPTNMGDRLRDQDGVSEVTHVPPKAALEEASRLLSLGDALEGLASNPLPGSYTVTLAPGQRSPSRMAALARKWGECTAWTRSASTASGWTASAPPLGCWSGPATSPPPFWGPWWS